MKKVTIDMREGNFGMFNNTNAPFPSDVLDIDNYTDLICKARSLINVCRTALMYKAEQSDSCTWNSASIYEIISVMDIAEKILPHDEFTFLDDLKQKYDETNN